jgi:5-methylcytosine-specific restriction endonuclease McrA
MLKACKYCGRIHDSRYDCGKKPQREKKVTYIDKFRSSRRWREKREQIRQRDRNLCQICIRNLYNTDRRYNGENLSVHHAIPLEKDFDRRLDDDNLLTVCAFHHEMAEAGLIPLEILKKIINEQLFDS